MLAAESRDLEAAGHLQRIADYGAEIAEALGFPAADVELYRLASPLHDIGKIGIPDDILKKPGRLTPAERLVMQEHALLGARLFDHAESPILCAAAEICRSHHERWDGSGYPHRLRGDQIPVFARILAVVDVFDALATRRCYKAAWTFEDAFAEVATTSAHEFDPDVLAAFRQVRHRIRNLFERHTGAPTSAPRPHRREHGHPQHVGGAAFGALALLQTRHVAPPSVLVGTV